MLADEVVALVDQKLGLYGVSGLAWWARGGLLWWVKCKSRGCGGSLGFVSISCWV